MVRQLNGQYKVKDAELKKHFHKIHDIIVAAPYQFKIRHVPREENREADELANRGINTMKILTI